MPNTQTFVFIASLTLALLMGACCTSLNAPYGAKVYTN